MARDYKSRAAQQQSRKPVSPWVWLLMGIIIGVLGTAFACYKLSPPATQDGWVGAPPPASQSARGVEAQAKKHSGIKPPEFHFFNLLPEQEVLIPEDELSPQPKPPAAKPAPAKSQDKAASRSGRRYLVQVSSFRSAKDAEALKAKLALLGLRAKVSRARIKGATWYRVQLGPYPSKSQMQDVRRQLASGGYNSLAIALK